VIFLATHDPQPKTVGEYTPCDTSNAVVDPTIRHVTIQPIAVLTSTLQLIPEHVLVFSNKPTPTVAPT